MSKPFTMVFYQIQNEQEDFHKDPTEHNSDSDSQDQQLPRQQHPNAFILSVPIQKLTFKVLKQRFPWRVVQRLHNKESGKFEMLFKIKDLNRQVDCVNIWLNLASQDDRVPLYDSDNIVFVKLRPF